MSNNTGDVIGINSNMVTASFTTSVKMNEVAYIVLPTNKDGISKKIKGEVIRVRCGECDLQIFEDTCGVRVGDRVEFTSQMLSIELGPGILSMVYDGLGNPLNELANKCGYYLERGVYLNTLNQEKLWPFTPVASVGDILQAGHTLGTVPEGNFTHKIMVPFALVGKVEVVKIAEAKSFTVTDEIAQLKDLTTGKTISATMSQFWPVKKAINFYQERLLPDTPLNTKTRIVDAFFPIAEGGTACVPGPFGSGKTVFQQSLSKYADADIVIVAACGERAGEVVETLREFPEITDPKTNRPLMERTVIICNTSSMPVASREASVYTAVTIAEYYRQMGLRALVLADSTSRWAQALREMSGRLEEIPGEEAFPAYLGSLIAAFYERAGKVCINDPNLGRCNGSVTLVGTVSPAGGNFEEPVTQSTLAVVGCFLGLTYARSYAKRFPAVSPTDSWSQYLDSMKKQLDEQYYSGWVNSIKSLQQLFIAGQKIGDQMKVVGEEDLSLDDFVVFLKSEFLDAAFMQQNAFDQIDAGPSVGRTAKSLQFIDHIIKNDFYFSNKDEAKETFLHLTTLYKDLNLTCDQDDAYQKIYNDITDLVNSKSIKFTQSSTQELSA